MGHRYIVYIYPKENEKKGKFLITKKIKEIKEYHKKINNKIDYTKIY